MNWYVWLFITFFIFIIMILIIPINIKTKIKFDVLTNDGKIELKIFKLAIYVSVFKIEKGYIELKSIKTHKTTLLPIIIDKNHGAKQVIEQLDFITILLKKIYVEHGTTYINFGAQSDCYITAIIIGIIRAVISSISAFLKTKKHESRIKNKIYPSFKKDALIICFKGSIRISIIQVIIAKIQANMASIKYKKEIVQYE